MKYFLALTMLLTVMQTTPPLPSRAADKSTQAAAQVKSKGTASQAPTLPAPATIRTDGSGPAKADGTEQRRDDEQHTIGISKLPSVSVTRDWADWGVWVFSLLLVVVGFLQVLLLWSTLGAIRRQADDMSRQVDLAFGQLRAMHEQITEISVQSGILQESVAVSRDAAKAAQTSADSAAQNVELIINKERARIRVEVPANLKISDSPFNGVTYNVHVLAPTAAIIVNAQVQAQVAESESPTVRWSTYDMHITSIDTQKSSVIQRLSLLFAGPELQKQVNEKQKFVHFFGFIKYRDVFQSETDVPHETTFGYLWAVGSDVKGGMPQLGDSGRWSSEWIEHPPGANKET